MTESRSSKYNLAKLLAGVFTSELGGYLTNTVILFHINQVTHGDKFYLGLALALFVGPLALGTLLGGAIGESYNRRKVMMTCDSVNLALVCALVFFHGFGAGVGAIIAVRACIVFMAGIYNPSRQAIVQELVNPSRLRVANAMFTTLYALLHSAGPALSAYAFQRFGGVREIFMINAVTYVFGLMLLYSIRYESVPVVAFQPTDFLRGVKEGFLYIYRRPDLNAMLRNFALGGICLGVFHALLLPFIGEVFSGASSSPETTYAKLMAAFGLGGIFGGLNATLVMRYLKKGKILVVTSMFQAAGLLIWTQVSVFPLSFFVLFCWGMSAMTIVATYVNYVQVNVPRAYQARAFSIFDQSISLNVCMGAAIVSVAGDRMSGYGLLTATAIGTLAFLVLQLLISIGVRELYTMET